MDFFDQLREYVANFTKRLNEIDSKLAGLTPAKEVVDKLDRLVALQSAQTNLLSALLDALDTEQPPIPPIPEPEPEPEPEPPTSDPETPDPETKLSSAPIKALNSNSVKDVARNLGFLNRINTASDEYPSGWFAEGENQTIDVTLAEPLNLSVVLVKMHNPANQARTYNVTLVHGDDEYPLKQVANAQDDYVVFADSVITDAFTLRFDGNDRTDSKSKWNGVYRIEIETSAEVTIEQPKFVLPDGVDFDQWPIDARTADFRTTYSDLAGYHLMKHGRDFVKNFRYIFGYEGQSVSVTNQTEFNDARKNSGIGIIRFVSPKPVVLIDPRRNHNSVQLLVCDTLSHIRTWGNIAIDCQQVSSPQAGGTNVISHGTNVLFSKAVDANINHTWADLSIQPPSPNLIRNVVTQGGARKGNFSAGAEKVSVGTAAWTGNWDQYWDDGVEQRDFPINTDNCGMQAMEDVDPGADTHQNLEMTDWLDPEKQNHPHGVITNLNPFVVGCLMAVLKAKWDPALGEGEQGVDEKAALMMLIRDCVMSGFMVNKIGANNAWGGGVFSSHFNVDKTKTQRCIGANQHRHIEIGSGSENLIEECLFADTQSAFDYVTKKGHDAGGQFDIVGYRETRYAWAKLGHETAVQARNNVFDHEPNYSMGSEVPFENDGELIVDPKFNVYKDFGAIGDILIGTTDPRAKGSIWYAG